MLSVCLIVKDEQKFISDCIEKVLPFADEIVVVDTGSTDDTKEILKKYDCKVYDYTWCNDFSKARNYSTEMASNDWVLILDADEHVSSFDKDAINKFINNKSNINRVGKIAVKSYFGDSIANFKTHMLARLYNRTVFHFEMPIHETIVPISKTTKISMSNVYADLPIEVQHYGYLTEVNDEKQKDLRNMILLEKHLETNFDGFLVQQLACCYNNLGRLDDAIKVIDTIIDLPEVQSSVYFAEVVNVKLTALITLNKFDEALLLEKYYDFCKDDDLFLMKMVTVFRKTMHSETAMDICVFLINKKDLQISRLEPAFQLAEIFFEYKLYEEALKWYKQIEIVSGVSEKIKICEQELGLN